MKKVMMMLATVCVVGMVRGAAVNWQFGKDTAYNGYTVYAFDNANSATILAALGAFDADAKTTIEGLVLSSKVVSKGNAKSEGVEVGSATSLMLLAINGDFEVDKGFSYDTLDISGSTYTPPQTSPGYASMSSFGNSGTIVAKGGGGGEGGVPEPTSCLLLLVGAGMLALRRKQK